MPYKIGRRLNTSNPRPDLGTTWGPVEVSTTSGTVVHTSHSLMEAHDWATTQDWDTLNGWT